jgi:hypothetical protein
MTGLAMTGSGITSIVVDPSNPCFRVCGDYLVDIDGTVLVRYCGKGGDVILSGDIEVLGEGCFSGCQSLLSMRFASQCKVRSLGEFAFLRCLSLNSICIPSSLETISSVCFYECEALSD